MTSQIRPEHCRCPGSPSWPKTQMTGNTSGISIAKASLTQLGKTQGNQWTTLEIHVCHNTVFTECQKLLGTRQIHLVQYFSQGSHISERFSFLTQPRSHPSLWVISSPYKPTGDLSISFLHAVTHSIKSWTHRKTDYVSHQRHINQAALLTRLG